jgi:hypothetical protein
MTDLLRFAEYQPDVVDYRSNSIRFARNVLPRCAGCLSKSPRLRDESEAAQ